MDKQVLNPSSLVRPRGYAHGISTTGGRLLFLAGQPGLDEAGNVVAPGDLVAQFSQALANLQIVSEAGGGTLRDIVKLTIYITDKKAYQANLEALGRTWRSFFGHYYPAVTLVEVRALFDDAAMVEIDGMAVIKE